MTFQLLSASEKVEGEHPFSYLGEVVQMKKLDTVLSDTIKADEIIVVSYAGLILSELGEVKIRKLANKILKLKNLKHVDMRSCFISDNEAYVFMSLLVSRKDLIIYNDVEGSIWRFSNQETNDWLTKRSGEILAKHNKNAFLFTYRAKNQPTQKNLK